MHIQNKHIPMSPVNKGGKEKQKKPHDFFTFPTTFIVQLHSGAAGLTETFPAQLLSSCQLYLWMSKLKSL